MAPHQMALPFLISAQHADVGVEGIRPGTAAEASTVEALPHAQTTGVRREEISAREFRAGGRETLLQPSRYGLVISRTY